MNVNGFPMHPHFVRPADSSSSKSQIAVLGTSGLNSVGREGEDRKEHDDAETRTPVVVVRPISPTKAQLEEHLPLHLNYRSWCPDCTGGKGHSTHHTMSSDEKLEGITWHMDYCFFSKKTFEEEEEESEYSFGVLVAYDENKDAFWALKIDKKGATKEVVKWCCDKLEDSGYIGVDIAIKCDQEPAIVDLRKAISAHRVGETVPISSPVRCSKANGRMENAVKLFQGQLRVLKHYMERTFEKYVSADSVLLSWLIPWVAESLNKFRVGSDGFTCYERITKHKCKHAVYGFAESVIWQLPPDKSNRDKLDGDFRDGIFLGVVWRTTEYIIGTPEGIFKCNTVKQRPEEAAYDSSCMNYITASYNDYILDGARTTGATVRFADPKARVGPAIGDIPTRSGAEWIPRRIYLKPNDFLKHGYTEGCKGCTWLRSGLGTRTVHSDECRERLETAFAEDDVDQKRLGVQKTKMDEFAAVTGEKILDEAGIVEPNLVEEQTAEVQAELEEAPDVNRETRIESPKDVVIESPLIDGPKGKRDRRFGTPVRKAPIKRGISASHDEGPFHKVVIRDDGETGEDTKIMTQHFDVSTPPRDERMTYVPMPEADFSATASSSADGSMKLSALDKYVAQRCILGADLTEVIKPEDLERISKVLGEACSVDVMEVYSPERVASYCREFGLAPGSSLDLSNGFDFDTLHDRQRAWEMVHRDVPLLIIGSPPCTYFSVLNELNKHINRDNAAWMQRFDDNLRKAKRHVKFCCSLYRHQVANNRYFLHEHPWLARSWTLPCIEEIEKMQNVERVRLDMCQYGMVSHVHSKNGPLGPVLKPTGMLTNSRCLRKELSKRCIGGHDHVHLVGGRASAAQEYPRELCQAICRGIAAQKRYDLEYRFATLPMSSVELVDFSHVCCQATGRVGEISSLCKIDESTNSVWLAPIIRPIGDFPKHWHDGVHDVDGHGMRSGPDDCEGEKILQGELSALYIREGVEQAVDDVSGAYLNPVLVAEARKLEMKFFDDMQVYDRVPRSEMLKRQGKIIKTRWIDVNKGDAQSPNYRSRLVGKEFKTYADDSLYASTPPLEALRLIMSRAATTDDHPRELMVNDVRRAYFYAEATRELYVELPEEDSEFGGSMVGRLRLCLYGTRDAALNWQDTLSKHLVDIGFKRGIGFPSVFVHEERDIWTLVHGDDYFSAGSKDSLSWLESELSKKYEIKTNRIGHGTHCSAEGQILNRVVRATERGYELEADPRHAELVVEQLGLQTAKGVTTPGTDDPEDIDEESNELLGPSEATAFRGMAARCNYLSADRPDIQFPVKELCREMSSPTARSMTRLKRVGRYLKHRPRLIWRYDFQADDNVVDVSTDANWCGCRISRKSTSGGAIVKGCHLIKAWSKTQAVLAKSSAESELYGVVKGACEGLGVTTLLKDLSVTDPRVRMHIDATAAKGIIERKGLNKLRHVETDILWLQEQSARRVLPLNKVLGTENVADLMTKNLPAASINKYIEQMCLEFVSGRSTIAQNLHSLEEVKNGSRSITAVETTTYNKSVETTTYNKPEAHVNIQKSVEDVVERKGCDSNDVWSCSGSNGVWRREHRKPRRSLFTPLRVARGPGADTHFVRIRETNGINTLSMKAFRVVDDWTQSSNAHKVLDFPWIGRTTFRVVQDSYFEMCAGSQDVVKVGRAPEDPSMETAADRATARNAEEGIDVNEHRGALSSLCFSGRPAVTGSQESASHLRDTSGLGVATPSDKSVPNYFSCCSVRFPSYPFLSMYQRENFVGVRFSGESCRSFGRHSSGSRESRPVGGVRGCKTHLPAPSYTDPSLLLYHCANPLIRELLTTLTARPNHLPRWHLAQGLVNCVYSC